MAEVTFEGVHKTYGGEVEAVRDLNLEIADGELMVLVGPSGCGKTTALRMVAGLEEITDGKIKIGDRVVNDLPPRERDVAMVFQNYALYPHKSVYDNLAFPLKLRSVAKPEIQQRVNRIAGLLQLDEQLHRKPRQLSGGQRQRVAMGRAIVREPQAFLMDEPLSNLDAKLRTQMRAEIGYLHKELRVTMIYVTHDQIEAMTLGEKVAVMRLGELQQVGRPQDLYAKPINLFVAGFLGSPAMNFVEAELRQDDGQIEVSFGSERLRLDEQERGTRPTLEQYLGRQVILGMRPESLEDAVLAPDTPADRRIRGVANLREELGGEVIVHFQVEAAPAVTDEVREIAEDVGELAVDELEHQRAMRRTALVGRFGPETTAKDGQAFDVAVDRGSLHLFDPESGKSIRG